MPPTPAICAQVLDLLKHTIPSCTMCSNWCQSEYGSARCRLSLTGDQRQPRLERFYNWEAWTDGRFCSTMNLSSALRHMFSVCMYGSTKGAHQQFPGIMMWWVVRYDFWSPLEVIWGTLTVQCSVSDIQCPCLTLSETSPLYGLLPRQWSTTCDLTVYGPFALCWSPHGQPGPSVFS